VNGVRIAAYNNSALMGGAMYFDTVDYANITESKFEGNTALSLSHAAGPPAVSASPMAAKAKGCLLQPLSIWRSKVQYMSQGESRSVSCIPLTVTQRSSIGQGGGMFFFLSGYISFFKNTFSNNVANEG